MKRQTVVGLMLAVGLVAGVSGAFYFAKRARQSELLAALPKIDDDQFNPSTRKLVRRTVEELKKQPLRADRWGELGYVLAGNRAFEQAAPCFERAEQLDPENFRWPHLLAFSTIHTDRPKALAALQRTLAARPNVVPTLGMLAEAYLDDGKEKEADALLRPLVTEKTSEPRLLFAMARIEANAGAVDQAIALGERAAANPPQSRLVHQFLAQVYQRKGDAGKARDHARLAELLPKPEENAQWPDSIAAQCAKYSRDVDVIAYRARLLTMQGNAQEALQTLEMLEPEERRLPGAAAAEAVVRMQMGDAEGAKRALEAASDQSDPNLSVARASIAMAAEKYAEAVEQLGRVTAVKPEEKLSQMMDGAHLYRGMCLQQLKKNDEAQAEYEAALKINPGNLDAIVRLADLYLTKNKKPEAKKILGDAALLEPTNEKVKELVQKAST
jgi:tetratricopeptide (TPR) repeat protein